MKNFSPYNIVREALVGAKENEQRVISGRFGIDSTHKTLSAIGKELDLSRERVRQIEKDGLKKIAIKILEQHKEEIENVVATFEKNGGVAVNQKIAEKFLNEAHQGDPNQFNALNLIFFVMPQLKKIKKTRELEEGWILAKISRGEAIKIIDEWVEQLREHNKPASLDVLLNENPAHSKYEIAFLSELPSISKKIIKTEEGNIGLASWSEINPRNIRDKIYYVLRKNGKPMHFDEIADRIKSQGFDNKSVVKATVHNELIADKRFVLVGRGIYALSEWGFQPGTVLDVIVDVLSGAKGALEAEEIIRQVLKQRVVKKNTIMINLKTKSRFKRVGESKFTLA